MNHKNKHKAAKSTLGFKIREKFSPAGMFCSSALFLYLGMQRQKKGKSYSFFKVLEILFCIKDVDKLQNYTKLKLSVSHPLTPRGTRRSRSYSGASLVAQW